MGDTNTNTTLLKTRTREKALPTSAISGTYKTGCFLEKEHTILTPCYNLAAHRINLARVNLRSATPFGRFLPADVTADVPFGLLHQIESHIGTP
jgi:hypothetical protein